MVAVMSVVIVLACHGRSLPDDAMPFNQVLFAGTHNSAINLGPATIGRAGAVWGKHPSVASRSYQYVVMDQRLSVRDQLEQGVRVIDLEVARLDGKWRCNGTGTGTGAGAECAPGSRCTRHTPLVGEGSCFACCPFIISHGSVQESVGDGLGYTYPEDVFGEVQAFVTAHPTQVVTLLLIASHGNAWPEPQAVLGRLNSSGLLGHVWNADPSQPWRGFPTLGAMRAANRTVMVAFDYANLWPNSPGFVGSHVNSSDVKDAGETCAGGTPCMEGWDAVSFFQLNASRAILGSPPVNKSATSLFYIENLSSRRGRGDMSADYSKLPNELKDLPFQVLCVCVCVCARALALLVMCGLCAPCSRLSKHRVSRHGHVRLFESHASFWHAVATPGGRQPGAGRARGRLRAHRRARGPLGRAAARVRQPALAPNPPMRPRAPHPPCAPFAPGPRP